MQLEVPEVNQLLILHPWVDRLLAEMVDPQHWLLQRVLQIRVPVAVVQVCLLKVVLVVPVS